MKKPTILAAGLLLALAGTGQAADKEHKTVEQAVGVLHAFSGRLNGYSQTLLSEAAGVAIIPHVVKAGLVVDHRFGRGVVLVRQPDGRWSHPLFLTLEGGGFGLEAGVEATDLILIFRSPGSLDRILHGKGQLTLGTDLAVAAGPLGREAEAPGRRRKAEVYAYSHSRGLFAGLSLEGDRLKIDGKANEAFYAHRGCRPDDVLTRRERFPAAEVLRMELDRLGAPPSAVIVPVSTAPVLPGPRR